MSSLLGPVLVSPLALARGENAKVQVRKDLSGGCTIIITDAKHPAGFPVSLSPDNAMGIAVEMLDAVGIPVKAALGARLAEVAKRGKP